MKTTRLRGARTHNLRGIDLDLAPGSLVVLAGPSGAGKSSLAFSTLYAEGQRRYVESFSTYARQFLERLARPPVDSLDPVPAAIAVDRQAPVRTSRSTVGTMTEIADYAKSLWARASTLVCPSCDREVVSDSTEGAADAVFAAADAGAKLLVTYRVPVAEVGDFVGVREALVEDGYRRVLSPADHEVIVDLDDVRPSDLFGEAFVKASGRRRSAKKPAAKTAKTAKTKKPAKKPAKKRRRSARRKPEVAATKGRGPGASAPELEVVADRLVSRAADRPRLVEAIETAFRRGAGRATVRVIGGEVHRFSTGLHCAHCERKFRPATPGMFTFNSPVGACEACRGFGRTIAVDVDKVIPDPSLSLADGALRAWQGKAAKWERRELLKHAKRVGVPTDVPVADFTKAQREWLVDGDEVGYPKGWWGIRGWFRWMESRAYKMHVRVFLSRYRKYETCADCAGTRLKPEALAFRIAGRHLPDFYRVPVHEALSFVQEMGRRQHDPATALLVHEVEARLTTLADVGLGYLTLDRASRTLSGGETQRVALTSALGASLKGAMFVLDEPTVGLHPSDVTRLDAVVRRLSQGDNVVIVVEHDETMIRGADRVVELGPGAGEAGGVIVFDGTPQALRKADTATGRALRSRHRGGRERRSGDGTLVLEGATGNNLVGVDLRIPRGALTVITGVSGSGKSSLILETLHPAVARALGAKGGVALPHGRLRGHDKFAGVVKVDQSPLGRTSRGNPATYLKIWDVIRQRFCAEPLAKERGYTPGTFSFNVAGGRCEACRGEGAETVEMQFLADVTFTCPECAGRRFVGEVLEVEHRGLSIADVLALTVNEAAARFEGDSRVLGRLRPLEDVGLGYLRLGQPLNTLSGGEAQRLKLAEALSGAAPGSLVLLDEPTAGLHAQDIAPLLEVLDRLVTRGDTVVVVEHDMRVAARADHVVDLGPGAGDAGGQVVAAGTPEEVAAAKASTTAPFLAAVLGMAKAPRAPARRKTRTPAVRDEAIEVVNAHEHNLQGVDIAIPREKFVVVTGPSGSGKSTLAFDVVYAEGQRRYLETLTPYARQYLPQLPRPAVDKVANVPPSVSLEQRTTRGGSNSTVATITEVAHYLRLLWATVGLLHCPDCQVPIEARSPRAVSRDLAARFGKRRRVLVLAPYIRSKKGIHREPMARARKRGFERARIDGEMVDLVPGLSLERYQEHDVDLVVGEAAAGAADLEGLLRRAMGEAAGTARIIAGDTELLVSEKRACPGCGRGFPDLDPRFFSFNTRQGACEPCEGRGVIVPKTRGRAKSTAPPRVCKACAGTRLSPLARSVTVDSDPITEILSKSVGGARAYIEGLDFTGRSAVIAEAPLRELQRRLSFLEQVGLAYLGLDRSADTLSGGEMQRVRLAAQLGSGLTGVLYVLDEPTIGLHPRDTGRLLAALRELVDKGNSVLVVEHDADTIRAADHVIDVGPGGGRQGGRVVATGTAASLADDPASVTGPSLARPPAIPEARRSTAGVSWLEVRGASANNLQGIDLRVPLGCLTAVTGVSGSGKSTLVREVLLRGTRAALGLVTDAPGAHRRILGAETLLRAVEVDQSPIGRTPRSVPATYVGIWDTLRKLLAGTPEARARGYGPSRFSFNVAEGRCPACDGQGALTVEMSFLPQVLLPCEACGGGRFDGETLAVRLHGLSVAEILDTDIADAAEIFSSVPKVRAPLALLTDLGLGYLKLGQASNTLSGGEAQRLKLVAELGTRKAGGTLYVMDEPTTGLHREDVTRLLLVIQRLVDRGDTVVVIEHHPDLILAADHVVDLGPEGGDGGGRIVATGTPEEVAGVRGSHTGKVLAEELRAVRPGKGGTRGKSRGKPSTKSRRKSRA